MSPFKVAADKTSNVIAVADKKPKSRLIVMNTEFNIKFLYNDSCSYLPNETLTEADPADFFPNDVCFDENGNIFIANCLGKRTIIMSKVE